MTKKNFTPLISIIIPAFNAEKYISETLDSILQQIIDETEIIVVDDGSTDMTANIVSTYQSKVKYIYQPNSGNCSSPRNTGLRYATGKYITFFDADDIMLPGKLKKQVEILEKHPDCGMVVCDYVNFTHKGETFPSHFTTCPMLQENIYNCAKNEYIILSTKKTTKLLIEENITIAGSPVYPVRLIHDLKGYEEKLKACEDFHLNYRVAIKAPTVVLNQVGFKRRRHTSNMSSDKLRMIDNYIYSRSLLLNEETNQMNRKAIKNKIKRNQINLVRLLCQNILKKKNVKISIKKLLNFKHILALPHIFVSFSKKIF